MSRTREKGAAFVLSVSASRYHWYQSVGRDGIVSDELEDTLPAMSTVAALSRIVPIRFNRPARRRLIQFDTRAISAGSTKRMYADRTSHWNSGMFREYSRQR